MKIIEEKYPGLTIPNELKKYAVPEKVLFFDIETTGLKKETTSLYLIGCGYYNSGYLNTIFFFGETPGEELIVLTEFFKFVKDYDYLIHFNGSKFDLPYLEYKALKYGIDNPLNKMSGIDIYQEIKPLRYLLFRESMKQKSVEDFLGITRNDKYNGGELIPVYFDYVQNKDDNSFSLLMMHNREDVLGMHRMFPIINYLELSNIEIEYIRNEISSYNDYFGNSKKELLLTYKYNLDLPVSFTIMCNNIYYKFDVSCNQLIIRIPICDCQMYHYYDNYRDYYYIPRENICVHKSIASSVDIHEREKATKDNCKIPVDGLKLPQFSMEFQTICGPDYNTRNSYFASRENFSEENWVQYGHHLITSLINNKPKRKKRIIENN